MAKRSKKTVGQGIVDDLREFADKLKRGDEIRGTRVELKDGKLVRERDVVVIPARRQDKKRRAGK